MYRTAYTSRPVRVLLTALMATGLIAGWNVAAPDKASAFGDAYYECVYHLTVNGGSSAPNRAYTSAPWNSNKDLGCGASKVRASYHTYSGSPLYYTTWVSSNSALALVQPSGTVSTTWHDCGYKAPAYSGSFPFLT